MKTWHVGLSRRGLSMASHITSIIMTRQFVGNVDPVGEILSIQFQDPDHFNMFKQWSNTAFSFSMLAFPVVSYIGNCLGPRKMSAVSMMTYIVGLLMTVQSTNPLVVQIGLCLLGLGFGASITAYYPLYLEFPTCTGSIVGTFGGASDISLSIPIVVGWLYHKQGIPVANTGVMMAGIAFILLCINWQLIPEEGWHTDDEMLPTRQLCATPTTSELMDIKQREDRLEYKELRALDSPLLNNSRRIIAPTSAKSGKTKFTDIVMDKVYLYFLVWFLCHSLRIKKHFMPFYRNMFFEQLSATEAASMTDVFSLCASLGFLSSIPVGYAVDKLGSDRVVMIITSIGFVFFMGLSLMPPELHYYISTVLFISQTGACFGLFSVLISKHEAQEFFGYLQASTYLIFGAACFVADYLWTPSFIENHFSSYRSANVYLTLATTGVQLLMMYLISREATKNNHNYIYC